MSSNSRPSTTRVITTARSNQVRTSWCSCAISLKPETLSETIKKRATTPRVVARFSYRLKRLEDIQQLDVKHQHAVRWDAADGLAAVGQLARYVQAPLAAGIHQLQGFDPAGDHAAYRELGWLAALVGAVEHGAVDQRAVVVGAHLIIARRLGTFASDQHLILQARLQHSHAFA